MGGKALRLVFAIFCTIVAAAAIVAAVIALCMILTLATIWVRGGPVLQGDLRLLIRGIELLLVTAAALAAIWWLARRVFGEEVFAGSFKQVSSKTGKTEWLALSIATVVLFAVAALLIYERTRGSEWVRAVETLGWLLVLFASLHIRVLLHELGHLMAAKIQRMQPHKVQIGTGALFWAHLFGGALRWEWRLWPQLGLVFVDDNRLPGFKRRWLVFIVAGPLVDALIVWAGYSLILQIFGSLMAAFIQSVIGAVGVILFWETAISAINGLIPHRIHLGPQHLYTDGYWLFHLCLLSNAKAQEFVRRKRWEQLEELARQARIYLEESLRKTA
jgi:hypothetical protein